MKPSLWGLVAALIVGAAPLAPSLAQTAASAPAAKVQPARKARKPAPPAPVLEQRAVDLLQAMSQRLGAARTMSFTAVASYEYPSRLGPPIVYTMRYDVAFQRPDQLKVVVPGDGPAFEFTVGGGEMVAFAPAENLVAVTDAPPAIEGALKKAFDTAAIYFPFTDMLLPDPYAAISPGAILAFVVGPSAVVGGVKTDMVVWANEDVFLQLWIGADDHLPRRIRAQFSADPRGLRHDLELANWQLDATLPPETFSTAKAKAGQPMAFAAPGRKLPLGVKPVAIAPSAKPANKPQ